MALSWPIGLTVGLFRFPSNIPRLCRVKEIERMKALLIRFVREDEGQDLIEYALLAAGISLAAIGGIGAIGGALNSKYSQISTAVSGAS
jgi:pilus assembly protein Flp/PilA